MWVAIGAPRCELDPTSVAASGRGGRIRPTLGRHWRRAVRARPIGSRHAGAVRARPRRTSPTGATRRRLNPACGANSHDADGSTQPAAPTGTTRRRLDPTCGATRWRRESSTSAWSRHAGAVRARPNGGHDHAGAVRARPRRTSPTGATRRRLDPTCSVNRHDDPTCGANRHDAVRSSTNVRRDKLAPRELDLRLVELSRRGCDPTCVAKNRAQRKLDLCSVDTRRRGESSTQCGSRHAGAVRARPIVGHDTPAR
jgi:hypothetical protein